MPRFLLSVSAILLASFTTPLYGQTVTVDEGAFRVILNGQVVGREEFSIHRVGMGGEAVVFLQGSVELGLPEGRLKLEPAIRASGGSMTVTAYQMKSVGAETSEIHVTRADRRFTARILSPRGEEVREYRAGPGSIILDPYVAHQYHLLIPFLDDPGSVSLTVLSPENGDQLRMTLSFVGEEETRVGTALVRARHFRLGGGDSTRDIWFDAQGRTLRVEIPALGYAAERESLI